MKLPLRYSRPEAGEVTRRRHLVGGEIVLWLGRVPHYTQVYGDRHRLSVSFTVSGGTFDFGLEAREDEYGPTESFVTW